MRDLSARPTDYSDKRPLQNGSLEQIDDEEDKDKDSCERVSTKKHSSVEEQCKLEEHRQKKRYTRLSQLRRRRYARKDGQDDSDLSEGFESEDDEEEDIIGHTNTASGTMMVTQLGIPSIRKETKRDPLGEEGCWASGSEEEEEGGTAFDVETDSDMNSQESRSDLEDIEDSENLDSLEVHVQEQLNDEENEDQPKGEGEERDVNASLATNGNHLMPSESSITSNLQAMSSQLFQAKRCFRLAPTFSNMLLRPQTSSFSGAPTCTDTSVSPLQEASLPVDLPCDLNPSSANGARQNGKKLILMYLFLKLTDLKHTSCPSFFVEFTKDLKLFLEIKLTFLFHLIPQTWNLILKEVNTAPEQHIMKKPSSKS